MRKDEKFISLANLKSYNENLKNKIDGQISVVDGKIDSQISSLTQTMNEKFTQVNDKIVEEVGKLADGDLANLGTLVEGKVNKPSDVDADYGRVYVQSAGESGTTQYIKMDATAGFGIIPTRDADGTLKVAKATEDADAVNVALLSETLTPFAKTADVQGLLYSKAHYLGAVANMAALSTIISSLPTGDTVTAGDYVRVTAEFEYKTSDSAKETAHVGDILIATIDNATATADDWDLLHTQVNLAPADESDIAEIFNPVQV